MKPQQGGFVFKSTIICILFLAYSGSVAAMSTEGKSREELEKWGAAVDAYAGSSQWQQLWKRVRDMGGFAPDGLQPRFTIQLAHVPGLTSRALSNPDAVTAKDHTRVLYRKMVPPPIGMVKGAPVNSVCLVVDFRSVPEGSMAGDRSYISIINLISALPCE